MIAQNLIAHKFCDGTSWCYCASHKLWTEASPTPTTYGVLQNNTNFIILKQGLNFRAARLPAHADKFAHQFRIGELVGRDFVDQLAALDDVDALAERGDEIEVLFD